jgi:hypothetical protein
MSQPWSWPPAVATTPLASGITNDSSVSGNTVKDALNTLNTQVNTNLAVAYAANVTLGVAANSGFQVAPLTGNITIAFSGYTAGKAGLIWIQQDAVGTRTVTFTTPVGYTLRRDENVPDLVAKTGASAQTRYAYAFYTIGGVNYLEISKARLV